MGVMSPEASWHERSRSQYYLAVSGAFLLVGMLSFGALRIPYGQQLSAATAQRPPSLEWAIFCDDSSTCTVKEATSGQGLLAVEVATHDKDRLWNILLASADSRASATLTEAFKNGPIDDARNLPSGAQILTQMIVTRTR
jgi:hypothetical protein